MRGTDLENYRKRLLELAATLKGSASGIAREALQPGGGEGSGGLSNTPLHLADLGSDMYERDMSVSLLENKTRTLEEIEEAIHRVDAGTFGRCQECGTKIGAERLQAVPFTPYCIDCARRLERENAYLPPPPTGP
jgi:DnaK suppressor protein